jgi:hypothetical protein
LLVGTLLGTAVLSACGGGDDAERLSADALTRRAESICAAGKREADRLRRRAEIGARGEAAAEEIDATLEALGTQIDGFEGLRGPATTDDRRTALVRHLRAAADGLAELRQTVIDDDLTVDEAIAARPGLVRRVNRSSAQAADDLVALDWLSCIGVAGG